MEQPSIFDYMEPKYPELPKTPVLQNGSKRKSPLLPQIASVAEFWVPARTSEISAIPQETYWASELIQGFLARL